LLATILALVCKHPARIFRWQCAHVAECGIALEKRAQQDALKSWEDAMTAYKAGISGPLTPLIARQQLLLADQRTALLESEQADISIRLIEALGGDYGAAQR
jgi:outer membrane protein TolC